MTIELDHETLYKIADAIWDIIKDRCQEKPEEICQVKSKEQNEVSQDTSISADVQTYHKFSSVLKIAKRIKIPNLTKSEFMLELSRRCNFIIPCDSRWKSRLFESLSYKFKTVPREYLLFDERRQDYIALVSSGMNSCQALTLSKLTRPNDLALSLDQCEITRRVFALYKDNKSLIDNYMREHPGRFKLPDFTQLENKVSNGINSSLIHFNRNNSLYPYKEKICDAINEIINIPNLSKPEFQFKLSQKLGRLVTQENWERICKQITYQFRVKYYGGWVTQEKLDRTADYISLLRCGMKSGDAVVLAKVHTSKSQHLERAKRCNIQPSDERVYRLYQESKELYDNYAKDHPEFKLPDFTKFTTNSNIFNTCDKEKEHVVLEKAISGNSSILTHDKVKALCDAYEHVVKSTTLTGIEAVKKAGEYAKINVTFPTLKKYIFGHAYIAACYQDIPTPVYIAGNTLSRYNNPEIRRLVCTIKLFRKKGFSITRIEKLFKEHGEKVSYKFIETVYDEVTHTQLGENLSNKDELSIAYQYKEQFPELEAHMREDLKSSKP